MLGGLLAWLTATVAFVAVAHPEECPTIDRDEVRAAASEAVGWLTRNQREDGRFVYRYDRERRVEEPGYNLARHAGTMLALYQAAGSHAVDEQAATAALTTGDAALDWATQRITRDAEGRWTALGEGAELESGPSALLLAALAERRQVTGQRAHDELMVQLGRFLVAQVRSDGSVAALWDTSTREPVAGSSSPFYTGETLFALARLHRQLPDDGWDEPALAIAHYVATARDDQERRFPPVSDHWTAYAHDVMAHWPEGSGLTLADVAYARRQAEIFGVQARFESQRREQGWPRLTRGPVALGAGLGTVGEGLGALWRAGHADPRLADLRDEVATRAGCVASVLAARQVTAPEADSHPDPGLVRGAWFRLGDTQVDDQQHALSALLAFDAVLTGPEAPS